MRESFFMSSSPHVMGEEYVRKIMASVLLALFPATLMGIYYYGMRAIFVLLLSVFSAVAAEYMMQKLMGRKSTITDLSAALTGLLLGLTLSPASPWWLVVVGGFIAIVIGKQIYGGLGHNLFNPALVSRVILLISWPVQMTTWYRPQSFPWEEIDAVSEATPLGILKTQGLSELQVILGRLVGKTGGAIGEVSVIALILGVAVLIWGGYITWHIPVSYVGTVGLLSAAYWFFDPAKFANPLFHITSGGLILGACYMATDYVTGPVTGKGRLIFGISCGFITTIIRVYGIYPEGVGFAILIMNALTPLINMYTKPTPFGMERRAAAE